MRSRNCLLLTVLAATASLGWPGQAAAIPVFYSIFHGAIDFVIIPNPPPHPPVPMLIEASFRYDAATKTESDVTILLGDVDPGNLIEQYYSQLDPLVTLGNQITATGIKYGNKLAFFFEHNFDGTANYLGDTFIQAPEVDASPHNPCGPFPRQCYSSNRDHPSAIAKPGLGGTQIPEPSSLSVFGLIGIIIGGMSLMSRSANRRRVG